MKILLVALLFLALFFAFPPLTDTLTVTMAQSNLLALTLLPLVALLLLRRYFPIIRG